MIRCSQLPSLIRNSSSQPNCTPSTACSGCTHSTGAITAGAQEAQDPIRAPEHILRRGDLTARPARRVRRVQARPSPKTCGGSPNWSRRRHLLRFRSVKSVRASDQSRRRPDRHKVPNGLTVDVAIKATQSEHPLDRNSIIFDPATVFGAC
jgi:hypothetical protein